MRSHGQRMFVSMLLLHLTLRESPHVGPHLGLEKRRGVQYYYLCWEDITWLSLLPSFPSPRGRWVVRSLCSYEKKGHTSCIRLDLGAGVRSWAVLGELPFACWLGILRPPCPLPIFLELFQVPTGTCLPGLVPCLWKARQEKE